MFIIASVDLYSIIGDGVCKSVDKSGIHIMGEPKCDNFVNVLR